MDRINAVDLVNHLLDNLSISIDELSIVGTDISGFENKARMRMVYLENKRSKHLNVLEIGDINSEIKKGEALLKNPTLAMGSVLSNKVIRHHRIGNSFYTSMGVLNEVEDVTIEKLSTILSKKIVEFKEKLGAVCDALVEINKTLEKYQDYKIENPFYSQKCDEIITKLSNSEQYKSSLQWISSIVKDYVDYNAFINGEKLPERKMTTSKEDIKYIDKNYTIGRKK